MLKYLILFCIPYIVYTINVMMQVNNVLSFRKHNRYDSKLSYMEFMPKSWPFTVPNCNVLVWMGVDSILKVLLLKGYYYNKFSFNLIIGSLKWKLDPYTGPNLVLFLKRLQLLIIVKLLKLYTMFVIFHRSSVW